MDLWAVQGVNSVISYMLLDLNVSKKCYVNNLILEREIPRDVFMKIRNENMRKNLLDEIKERNP